MSILTIGSSCFYNIQKHPDFFPKKIFANFKHHFCNKKALTSDILNDNKLINDINENNYDYILINLGIVDCYTRYNKEDVFKKKDFNIETDYYQLVSYKDFFLNFKDFFLKINTNSIIIIFDILEPQPTNKCKLNSNFQTDLDLNYFHILEKQMKLYNKCLKSFEKNNIFVCDLLTELKTNPDFNYDEIVNDLSTHLTESGLPLYNKALQNILKKMNLNDKRLILDLY